MLCLALLTLVFTFTYSTNMILAEIFFDRLGGILPYVLVLLLIDTLRRLLTYKLTIHEDEPLKPFSSSSKSSIIIIKIFIIKIIIMTISMVRMYGLR